MNNEEIKKLHDFATNNSIKCKCGHSILISHRSKKVICNWCKNYVFLNKQDEFEYELKKLLKEKK